MARALLWQTVGSDTWFRHFVERIVTRTIFGSNGRLGHWEMDRWETSSTIIALIYASVKKSLTSGSNSQFDEMVGEKRMREVKTERGKK